MLIVQLMMIGLVAGSFGGMLGIGGSLIMIPAMTEVLGPDQHLYQAAAMIVNVFVAAPAVYQHRKAGAIEWATVARMFPIAAVAVVGGVLLSELPVFAGDRGEPYLRGLFGIMLFALVGYELFRLLRKAAPKLPFLPRTATLPSEHDREATTRPRSWSFAMVVAVPTGLVAGLMGVGGGALAVPLQRRFLGLPMRAAIANSSAVIVATATVGATAKNIAYAADQAGTTSPFLLAAVLIPTAIVGSLFGSRLTHRLPVRAIKVAFLLFLLVAAIRLTSKAASQIRSTSTQVRAIPARVALDRLV
ncbi:MAG: sulfite exporter TauE/SafE family protein [Phycisphaerae bacterium]